MTRLVGALALAWIAAFSAFAAHAAEVIERYAATLTVLPSGVLEVEEEIVVRSEGQKIRRGIFRDFQTDYQGDMGRSRTTFSVQDVKLDGGPVPWQVTSLDHGKRLQIGDKDKILSLGLHTFSIRFQTRRQLMFLPERDELTYQAIAYGWDFPILNAEVTVNLPDGVSVSDYKVSAGAAGAGEGGAAIDMIDSGTVLFRANGPLKPGEGMTVALTWPAGHVARPDRIDGVFWFLRDNLSALLALLGVLVVFPFYLWVWARVGRDPPKGVIIALYEPPHKMSPAAARFVIRHGWDDTGFSAAIVNLAVKGALRIEEADDKTITVHKAGTGHKLAGLSSGEKSLFEHLFSAGDSLTVKQKHYKILQAARSAHKRALAREHMGVHFNLNRGVFAVGLLISAGFVLASVMTATHFSLVMAFSVLLLVLLNAVFFYLLRAPTLKGRKLMDEIEGFRRYLEVAEKDRMNFHNPPKKTPELFERYLPYAIALGVEQAWGRQFDAILKAVRDPNTGKSWQPNWYSGRQLRSGRSFNPALFSAAVGSGMASSFSAAATPPSSSSGSSFGGGGFSGGSGGGGGGGGGW